MFSSVSVFSIGYDSLKYSRRNTKGRWYECYEIFIVKCMTDLQYDLTKAIFSSMVKPKLRKAEKLFSQIKDKYCQND